MNHGLIIKRRILPHWRLEYSTYFVTWTTVEHDLRLDSMDRDTVTKSILFYHPHRCHIWAYVVMDDHVHLLVTPKEYSLTQLTRGWKSFTARKINRRHGRSGAFWLSESYDRIIRSEGDFVEKLEYILNNPLRRWPGTKECKWAEWTKDEFSVI